MDDFYGGLVVVMVPGVMASCGGVTLKCGEGCVLATIFKINNICICERNADFVRQSVAIRI